MTSGLALTLAVLLLLLNAFFVAGEFCVTSSRISQVLPLAEEGRFGARDALWALENVSSLLAALQFGITLASTALGAIAEPAFARIFEGAFRSWGVGELWVHPAAFLTALLLVVVAHIILGEMVPKNLAVAVSVPLLLVMAPVLRPFTRLLGPVVHLFNRGANALLGRLGIKPQEHIVQAFTASQVATLVEEAEAAGALEDPGDLLASTMELTAQSVGEVMVERSTLVTLSWPLTCEQVESVVARTGFSRFPVVCELNADGGASQPDWVGYIHLKDALFYSQGEARFEPLPDWKLRPLESISPNETVAKALSQMQQKSLHLLSVRDDAGELLGAVFLEDLLEELVGEIHDAIPQE